MRKIKRPKIGDYVLVSWFSDKDVNDPWYLSFITEIRETKDKLYYLVEGSNRWWRHVWRLSFAEGDKYLKINKAKINYISNK